MLKVRESKTKISSTKARCIPTISMYLSFKFGMSFKGHSQWVGAIYINLNCT